MNEQLFTVGQAARASGLSPKAIRLYEHKGLLPPAERTEAGYRLFSDDDLATLRFVRQAKTLGLRLDEIGDILDLRRGGSAPCQHVLRLLDQRIAEIDRTIAELRQLRTGLARTRRDAAGQTRAAGGVCRIIEHAPQTSENDWFPEVESRSDFREHGPGQITDPATGFREHGCALRAEAKGGTAHRTAAGVR
ncbi:MAG: heavy metal-responsive transcriptional regulator [Streptosporangiaceae bacterium]